MIMEWFWSGAIQIMWKSLVHCSALRLIPELNLKKLMQRVEIEQWSYSNIGRDGAIANRELNLLVEMAIDSYGYYVHNHPVLLLQCWHVAISFHRDRRNNVHSRKCNLSCYNTWNQVEFIYLNHYHKEELAENPAVFDLYRIAFEKKTDYYHEGLRAW